MKSKDALLKAIKEGRQKFAPLIDPDKFTIQGIKKIAGYCRKSGIDIILYGGSLITKPEYGEFISVLKENCESKIVLFPGNNIQINVNADGILLLSLISGRNPDLLIGKHVVAAPFLKDSGLEIIPTGYMLIDGGRPTAVTYISNTVPIPSAKEDIAMCTAMAGEMLGLKLIYMDAGSGADEAVPADMIRKVKQNIEIPLIVGGGIRSIAQVQKTASAGADLVVVGNAIESKPELILKLAEALNH